MSGLNVMYLKICTQITRKKLKYWQKNFTLQGKVTYNIGIFYILLLFYSVYKNNLFLKLKVLI